jgi:hypothetical protein
MREKGQDRRQKGDSSPAPTRPGSDFVMERFGSIRDMDRSFDIAREKGTGVDFLWDQANPHGALERGLQSL